MTGPPARALFSYVWLRICTILTYSFIHHIFMHTYTYFMSLPLATHTTLCNLQLSYKWAHRSQQGGILSRLIHSFSYFRALTLFCVCSWKPASASVMNGSPLFAHSRCSLKGLVGKPTLSKSLKLPWFKRLCQMTMAFTFIINQRVNYHLTLCRPTHPLSVHSFHQRWLQQ